MDINMKLYGLCIKHKHTIDSKWGTDFSLTREGGIPIQLAVDNSPSSYSGRDFFTFADVGENLVWLDVYRATASTKLTPGQYFQINGISCIAHKICSKGKEPALILIGDSPSAFSNIQNLQLIDISGFGDLLSSYYPAIKLSKVGDAFIATVGSDADIYWETTGGVLSTTRSKSGESVRIQGAAIGTKIRVGWKYFSNATEVTL